MRAGGEIRRVEVDPGITLFMEGCQRDDADHESIDGTGQRGRSGSTAGEGRPDAIDARRRKPEGIRKRTASLLQVETVSFEQPEPGRGGCVAAGEVRDGNRGSVEVHRQRIGERGQDLQTVRFAVAVRVRIVRIGPGLEFRKVREAVAVRIGTGV